MNRNLFILSRICFFLVMLLIWPLNCFGTTIQVHVDASRDLGPVPDLFTSSVWIANPGRTANRYIFEKFMSENRPAVIHLTLRALTHSKNLEDYKIILKNYIRSQPMANLIKKAKEYNTILIVGFETASMPAWLSSRPGNSAKPFSYEGLSEGWTVEQSAPPRDFNLWSKIVKFTLQSFIDEFELTRLGFFVGHEPDGFWFGDEKSFFKYYEYAARAAKQISKSIKVGGIGTQSLMQRKIPCNQLSPTVKALCRKENRWADPGGDPMLKNFIKYVASNDVPLDFLNWHSFNVLPITLRKQGTIIRKWLQENGLDEKKIILYPSDWSYWSWYAGGYPADYLDTEETAAYSIHALYNMWKGGISWHGHDFDIDNYSFEEKRIKQRQNAAFIGDWRIFTRNGVIKPIYNAMRAIDMISSAQQQSPRMIEATFPSDSTLVAIPVLKGNKVYVLLSNFTPIDTSTLGRYMLEKTKEKMSFVKDEIYRISECIKTKTDDKKKQRLYLKTCKNEISAAIKDPQKLEALDFATEIYSCRKLGNSFSKCLRRASLKLKNPQNRKIANELKSIEIDSARPVSAKIQLENLPFNGDAELITYTIDANHSNACKYNKKTEPSPTESSCGIGGDVDQALQEIRNHAKKETAKTFIEYLRSQGYKQEHINKLVNKIKKCDTDIRTCLKRLRKNEAFKSSSKSARIKQDFPKVAKKCRDTYYSTFYYDADKSINSLNARDEIALDGSKQISFVKVKHGKYTFELKMQMNSVWLLILAQKD